MCALFVCVCAGTVTNELWVWGMSYRGALTVGSTRTPVKAKVPAGEEVAMVAVGASGQQILGQTVDGMHMVVVTRE